LIIFISCSHVFGTALDQSGVDGSGHIAAAADEEDEYETVKRQRSQKRARIAAQRSPSLEV
jgi:predicted aminopeptidase